MVVEMSESTVPVWEGKDGTVAGLVGKALKTKFLSLK